MKYILPLLLLLNLSSLQAASSMKTWFEEGSVKGKLRYYYIETKKDIPNAASTSAHANTIGGQLNYTTGNWNGLELGTTFMTTQGFALPNVVDASNIGRDNGIKREGSAGGKIAQDSFSILGEAFVKYSYKDLSLLYGRKVIKTPLVNAKDVRMIPSSVQGGFLEYKIDSNFALGASHLTHFKQRTADEFTNITKHALGTNMQAITGQDEGDIYIVNAKYQSESISAKLYNYCADNFMNSLYVDANFKNKLASGLSYSTALQYINQVSIGNSDDNLANNLALSGGQISSNAFGLRFGLGYDESKLDFSASKVLSNSGKHDSLVLPWDGTPLLTNMITSNNLFQSNYGKALTSDSVYIGGSRGLKLAYTQKYNFTGIKGLKTVLSFLNVKNDKFSNNQRDYNAVIAYGTGDFSLALKGIWVFHNSSADAQGNVTQIDRLTQYRVIANYAF